MRRIERVRPNASLVELPAWTDEMEEVYRRLCGPIEARLQPRAPMG